MKGNNDDSDNDPLNPVFSALDAVGNVASQPTPGIDDMALGFPILVGLIAVINAASSSSPIYAILLVALFGGFAVLGRAVVGDEDDDDDDEENLAVKLDGLALVGALLSTGILAPASSNETGTGIATAIPLVIVAVGLTTTIVSQAKQHSSDSIDNNPKLEEPPDKTLLDLWDDEFKKQSDKSGR